MFKEGRKAANGVTDTLIGAGTEMNGHLKSIAGVRIEGAYHGDIESKGDIVIGEGGMAKSNITARDVTIAGKVYGDVHTKGKLIITATGQLHGNSLAAILLVQEGGILNGTSHMEREEPRQNHGAETAEVSASTGGNSSDRKKKQAG
ncbi:bactofilin family protein [Cohnella lupini]|uniref:Cytoskeletal protein CcmA (Bactofilin family) n=1 Tax=Cohnella lupini TaxID=1294267 RepID=A0A3D9ITJ3_9BACL|nr:polymer-forming cytoskeletal protein [Cohnella lupini]RED65091.1 cytoskeletal protein CcmA (bactofilin family) [Cohnella lupini]